jgi:hypothetical protein
MKYAVEMGSGAMIYMPSFMYIGSGIENLVRGIHRQTDSNGDLVRLLLFCRNKHSRLKTNILTTCAAQYEER